jgi:hypothetical protein
MPENRFYPLDAGRLARPAQVLVCESDLEAIEKAKRLMRDGLGLSPPFDPRGPERAGS